MSSNGNMAVLKTDPPAIDKSGHIKVSRGWLIKHFNRRSEILHANHISTSPSGMYFSFRNTPEVRRELRMLPET
jgi:hypothetical protein